MKKESLIWISHCLCFFFAIIGVYFTFFVAYFGGSYKTVININRIGEVHAEMFMLVLLFPIVLYGLVAHAKKIRS